MKLTNITRIASVAACTILAGTTLPAQIIQPPPNPYPGPPPGNPYAYQWAPYPQSPFYLEVDLGASLMQTTSFKNTSTGVSFHPGVRGSFIFGYNVAQPLAVEFETGTIWNRLNTDAQPFPTLVNHADLYQIPFLANLVFNIPMNNGVSIYLGAGCGGVASELDVSQPVSNGFETENLHSYDTDFTFAYQGKAGIQYAFAPNMTIGVSYKFLGTLDHTWFKDDPTLYTRSEPTYTHAILASFTWRF